MPIEPPVGEVNYRESVDSVRARLRYLCLGEAATLLILLLIAVPIKHLMDYPLAVSVMGPLHGCVFLIFCWKVVQWHAEGAIPLPLTMKLIVAACLPFGGVYSWWRLR